MTIRRIATRAMVGMRHNRHVSLAVTINILWEMNAWTVRQAAEGPPIEQNAFVMMDLFGMRLGRRANIVRLAHGKEVRSVSIVRPV